MRLLVLFGFAVVPVLGCGVSHSSEPDTPHEAIFRQQLGILVEAEKVLRSVKNQVTAHAAVGNLKNLKDTMRELQKTYPGEGPGILAYKSELRGTFSTLTKDLIRTKVEIQMKAALLGYSTTATDIGNELEEIQKAVGPAKS